MNKTFENVLIITLYYLSIALLAAIPYIFIVNITPSFEDPYLITAFIVSYFTVLIVLMYFIGKEMKKCFKSFRESILRNLAIIGGVFAVAYVANIVANVITQLLGETGNSENQSDLITMLLNANDLERVLLVSLFVLVVPIIEEIVFRKALYGIVKEIMSRLFDIPRFDLNEGKKHRLIGITSILVSSIAFALIHINGDYIFLLQYGSLALLLGTSYYLSKENIYVPIIIHIAQNTLATIQILYLISIGVIA